jgi:hypothetical protein
MRKNYNFLETSKIVTSKSMSLFVKYYLAKLHSIVFLCFSIASAERKNINIFYSYFKYFKTSTFVT